MHLLDPIVVGILFPLFWISIGVLLSILGGWFFLAKNYNTTKEFVGTRWRVQSASFRYLVSYRGALTLGANGQGIMISVMFLFRIGHPPLFIRWEEITKAPQSSWIFGQALYFKRNPSIRMRVQPKIIQRFELEKGSAIPHEQ